MKYVLNTRFGMAMTAMLVLSFTVSCSRFGKLDSQDTGFATFIKAHTRGIISDKATIRVELASSMPEAVPGADLKDGILTFSPSINGTSRWLSSNMIEFIPETGALKNGESYTGRLRLDKIQKVSSRKFRRFSFKFMVAIKEAVLAAGETVITAANPEYASVDGTISLTEELPLETVQKMVCYDYPETSAEISVTPGPDPLHFHFGIINLARGNSDRTLIVRLKAGDTGFKTDSRIEVTVPATGIFRIVKTELVEADDPYILVSFSEALDANADEPGMFEIEGVGRCHVQTEGSNARLFFDNPSQDPIRLTISEAVKSHDGQVLGIGYSNDFSFMEEKPAVIIPVVGNILPDSKNLILPFKAVNLKCLDIKVVQIFEENVLMFLQDNDLNGSNSIRRSGRLVCKRCLRLDSDPSRNLHKWQNFSVDLSELFKQEPGAIYRVTMSFKQDYSIYGLNDSFRSGTPSDELKDIAAEDVTEDDDIIWDEPYPYYYDNYFDWDEFNWEERDNPMKPSYYMEDGRFPSINLLTSNLGIIAKYSGGDKIWISVSDILDADPVFNAEIYVYNYQLKEIGYAKTGTDGMAKIDISGKPFAVVAKRGGATSYLKVTENNENSLSRFDVGGKALEKGLKAFIYGERGVWRPADTLHVTLILDDKEDKIPDTHPVSMEIYTPEGQFYKKLINSNGKDGFYTFVVPTKPDDPTGTWNAYFKIGGATFHKALKIESVKPNRLKVNLDINGKTIMGGSKSRLEISSSWLTGPPASNLKATVRMNLSRGGSTFPGFDGYVFTSPVSEYASSSHNLLETRLDNNGRAVADIEMPPADEAPGMLIADIVTTVQETGGDLSFSTLTMPYSPFDSYVGLYIPESKSNGWLETDKDYSFKIAAVDGNGKRVSGVNVSYSIYKLKWSWWWESRGENLDSYVDGTAAEALASGSVVSGKSDASIPFRIDYPEWGRYLVVARNMDSGHVCGKIIHVDWPAERGRSAKTDPEALTMLSFTTDKDSYDVGETATVYIPSSSKGYALVSLENSRQVISREWVKASGEDEMKYSFKITKDMAPNFYVHVSLVQPHGKTDNDLPIRLYGVRPVMVNDAESKLEPVITMPDVLKPEEKFTIKIRESKGRPMTYTLAIVDEGLLDITSFKTPDPWAAMHEREALGVRTWDLYDDVIGAYSGRFAPMFSVGGDEAIRMGAKRDNRFNPIVKVIGPHTLQSGTASHKITLPTYVGSVRVMVVAAKDAAYGSAEKTVPVKSPLMVLPSLSRTLSKGEKIVLPVNVFALEQGVGNVSVEISTEGAIAIDGDSKVSLNFSAPGDQIARFNLEATGTGTAKIHVSASGGGHKASDDISLTVKRPDPAVLAVTRAMIPAGESKHFNFSPFSESEDCRGTLDLAACPHLDAEEILSFVQNYPYAGTEQICSRGLSLIKIRGMLNGQKTASVDRLVTELIQQLCQRQRSNGGFALWNDDADTGSWVSSMAGHFLIEASMNGYSVSKGVLASWARYQKKCVQEYRNNDSRFLWDLEQAYRLYTLALKGEPESGAMNRLKGSTSLSQQASWMLASTYSLSGKKTVAQEILEQARKDFSTYKEKDATFGSPLRDKAIALEAMVLSDCGAEALELAEEIVKAANAGYCTTQEYSFCTVAMAALAEKMGTSNLEATVIQGKDSSTIAGAKTFYTLPVNTETGCIEVKNTSESAINAALTLSTVPENGERTDARSSGISLKVEYIGNDGKILNPAEIAQGTDFTAVLTVGNTSLGRNLEDMALVLQVPSGWEIVNEKMAGTGIYSQRDIRDDRVIWHFNLERGEAKTFKIRLMAAYEGEFTLPAVKCEAMYDPHVCANTASDRVKVMR